MIYLEHDDGHNEPIVYSYDTKELALDAVLKVAWDGDAEFATEELFSENGSGEYTSGSDKWTVLTAVGARATAEYWTDLAEKMEKGLPV